MTEGETQDVGVSGNPTPPPAGGDPAGDVGDGFEGAPDDEEMPLADHVEEMVRRLGIVVLLMAVVSAFAFPLADRLINFLWYSFLPGVPQQCPPPNPTVAATGSPTNSVGMLVHAFTGVPVEVTLPTISDSVACPRLYHPLALVLARLKVASLVGFVAALPMFVYQTYLFMRPGLYPKERRYYLASVPTSLVLAAVGLLFAYLLVLPLIFTYFLGYTQGAAEVAFGLSETFDLILLMLGMFAFIFQIPLFVMLAIMMGVTNRIWLESRRLYFWAAFGGIAFLFSPDPTGMAPFIVAVTMIILFEGTLALLRWSGHGSMAPGPREIATLRPLVWFLSAVAGYLASPVALPGSIYDDLPGLFTGGLEALGLSGLTPLLVGLTILGLYEGLAFVLRRQRAPRQVRLALRRFRGPVWLVAIAVGYLANPNPALLETLDVTLLGTETAAALAVTLIVAYEAWLAIWRWRIRRRRP